MFLEDHWKKVIWMNKLRMTLRDRSANITTFGQLAAVVTEKDFASRKLNQKAAKSGTLFQLKTQRSNNNEINNLDNAIRSFLSPRLMLVIMAFDWFHVLMQHLNPFQPFTKIWQCTNVCVLINIALQIKYLFFRKQFYSFDSDPYFSVVDLVRQIYRYSRDNLALVNVYIKNPVVTQIRCERGK